MKRSQQALVAVAGAWVLAGVCFRAWADAKPNPYDLIVERNLFGLKPPPPPDANPPPGPPAAPPAQVEVTGITSILTSKRALLEIIPGPGKPMIKPILAEGERVESVEVVSIDVEKNEVTIRNGGVVTNLTFKVIKSPPSAPAPTLAGIVPPPHAGSVIAQPIQTPSSYNQNPAASGRNSVMVAGGNSGAAPASAYPPGVPPAPVSPTIGTPTIATPNIPPPPPTPGGADVGFRQIPSRNIRTTTPQGQIDPDQQRILMEANRLVHPNYPPLPTSPLNQQ